MLASLKGAKLGKGPLSIPLPGKKDSGEKTKVWSASHGSLIQKHSDMNDSLLSMSEENIKQRKDDFNALRTTRSAPSVGSRAHKFQASLEIARQLREKTGGHVDNIAADFLSQTGSFWAELNRPGPAQVTFARDGLVGASFNRLLEKWLLIFQDAESGADPFCDDFVMLFGLLPDDQPYCLLGKLLVDVMSGPTIVTNKSVSGHSDATFSAKAFRSLNIFKADVVEKRLQASTIVDTVCQALDYWLAVRPEDWATWEMALLWQNFVDKARTQYGQNVPEAILILDRHLRSPSWSFQFMDVNPREMAQQLTVLDHRLIKNIRMSEFRNGAWSKHANGQSTRLAPNILSAIIHANNVAVWVSAMVLNGNGVKQRARIIERFITIARHLRELRNYNTLMAIHSALTGLVVQRLKETIASIDGKHKAVLTKLTTLLSPENNYACYRKELREQQALGGVVIPFLGLCLRDYTYVDVLESTLDSDQYNVKKMRMMGDCLRPVWLLQRESVGQSDEAMEALISIMLQPRLSYEELVDISREMTSKGGRELDHPPISKRRKPEDATRPEEEKTPLLQGDAAVAVPSSVAIEMSTSPNARQELQRHIENLVTYIFNQFDDNGDGNISRQEFDAVLSSFPFVDFELIDANQDNILSRQEVEDYFMVACFAELVFKKLDKDSSNAVTREEFNAMAEILPGVPFDFDDIDQDGNGTIQLAELRAAFFNARNRHKISTSSLVPSDDSPRISSVGIAVDCIS